MHQAFTKRAASALLVAVALAGSASAQAQSPFPPRGPPPPPMDIGSPPISPADMANYCVYENRVYSLGSGLCFGRTAFVCIPSQGPATGNRAYWSSKDDQVFGRPACS